jgi:predicted nucleic acid-binding protein
MIYVDTNVVLDILQRDAVWFDWSLDALERGRAGDRLVTGLVVAAEVGHYVESTTALARSFTGLMIDVIDADLEVAFGAGQAYREYRRRGGERLSLLPDFLVGAHAMAVKATILTRDPRIFRSYFPDLPLITPETDNG